MKKPKPALLYFLAALGVIGLIIMLFLGIWGFRPLIPDIAISPNWEAWQTLSTILLAGATLYLTWYIAKRQERLTKNQDTLSSQQENLKIQLEKEQFEIQQAVMKKELKAKELELKISLYDKRFKVYECFKKYAAAKVKDYAEAGETTAMKLPDGQELNGSEALSIIILNSEFINGRRTVLEELHTYEIKETLTKAEQTKKGILNQRMVLENIEFWTSEIRLIEQSEFCFDTEESEMLINYINAVFNYANLAGKKCSKEEFANIQLELLSAIEEIESKNLIDGIKDKLNLSYKEINV